MYWQPLSIFRKNSHCVTHRSRAMVYVMRAIFPLADFPLSLRWYSNHPCRILWKHKLQLGKIGQNTATLCMYIHSTHHMIHTTGCISVIFDRFWSLKWVSYTVTQLTKFVSLWVLNKEIYIRINLFGLEFWHLSDGSCVTPYCLDFILLPFKHQCIVNKFTFLFELRL